MNRLSQMFYRPSDRAHRRPCVLLAEDDTTVLALMSMRLKALGYLVDTVRDGLEAWEYLQVNAANLDAVVLDRMMPGLDGMEVMKRIGGMPEMHDLPVVMHTAADRPEQIREGIEAGVFYYLTKPCPEMVLDAVVSAAVRESVERRALMDDLQRQHGGFKLLRQARLTLRTLEEAENAACWLAMGFEDARRVVYGLDGLLVNAVEHGNAGLQFAGKGESLKNGTWRKDVAERLDRPENRGKRVTAEFSRGDGVIKVVISDQGPGFDWRKFSKLDPERAQASHGRGIARAKTICFDGLEYNAAGNQVTVWVDDKKTE